MKRLLLALLIAMVAMSSCTFFDEDLADEFSDEFDDEFADESGGEFDDEFSDEFSDEFADEFDDESGGEFADEFDDESGGEFSDCLPDVGSPDASGIVFTDAFEVIDGELGDVCFGDGDATVERAWELLADMVPRGQRRDLDVFAGFEADSAAEADTAAFVQALGDEGLDFLMAVNVEATASDWDEAKLTVVHEMTHVFTALPAELDRTIEPEDCETFDNGEGCYAPDSILNQWFDRFWTRTPGDPTDDAAAGERCDLDAGYFGSYAASNPEEDFAEAFSAYVLQVEAVTPGQQDRLDFIDDFPGLREFRDRAIDAGHGPLANNFDRCG